jgi:2'-5' RNA ligase
LHFIGETPPEQAEILRLSLAGVVARHQRFALTTGGLGVIPDLRQPRVLWLGLGGNTLRLEALHRDLGRQLAGLDFEVDRRRYHPHITLGRVRDNPPQTLGREIERAFADPRLVRLVGDALLVPVDEVLLVRSFLERSGARHVPIATYPL